SQHLREQVSGAGRIGVSTGLQSRGPTTQPVTRTSVQRQPAAAVGPTNVRSTASFSEIRDGFVRHISAKWATLDLWKMVKDMLWSLIWPWPDIGRELSGLWGDVKTAVRGLFTVRNVLNDPLGALHDLWTNLLHLLDIPLAIWRRLNNILMLLMGWITIALVVIGAVG